MWTNKREQINVKNGISDQKNVSFDMEQSVLDILLPDIMFLQTFYYTNFFKNA